MLITLGRLSPGFKEQPTFFGYIENGSFKIYRPTAVVRLAISIMSYDFYPKL